MSSTPYQLVDEASEPEMTGHCYRIYQVVSLGGESRSTLVSLGGTVAWELPAFYKEDVVKLARDRKLTRSDFLNGDGLGEKLLPASEFEQILADISVN